jgi:transcriptional regulator with XRE-family HTH domain
MGRRSSRNRAGIENEPYLQAATRIRELRTRRGLVIEELAKKTGLSKPYISQIETGKASPSLSACRSIAHALGIPLAYLFLEDTFACHIVRANERTGIAFGAPDKLVYLLSAPDRHLEVVLMNVPAGYASSGGRFYSHEGEECHFVLEGTVHAVQGDRTFVFNAGDCFHWDGSIPHRVENPGSAPAKVLVARIPPGFLDVTIHEPGQSSPAETDPGVGSPSP